MRYATPENWAQYFEKSEGVQICGVTIKERLKKAEIIGKTGRNKVGVVLGNAFYSEADVYAVCANLLQRTPYTDENGFLEKDGEKYGTILSLSKLLGIPGSTIRMRIKIHNPQYIKGKDKGGRIFDFYPESAIRLICADLLHVIHQADETGLLIKDGERYMTKERWSKNFGISYRTIIAFIKTHRPQSIKGKVKQGRVSDFYSESTIRQICVELPQKTPQADESALLMEDGQRFGTINTWAKMLGISATAIMARIKTHNLQSIKGKNIKKHVSNFYPESAIREICADLLLARQSKSEGGAKQKNS